MANKDTAKAWFETGDTPTEANFHQTLEWLRWKDEKIQSADLDPTLLSLISSYGRTVQLPAGTMQYVAPAGTLIEKFFFGEQPGTVHPGAVHVYTVKVGLTPGGGELVASTSVDIDTPNDGIISITGHYCLTATTLYFTTTPTPGEPNAPLIKIYKS